MSQDSATNEQPLGVEGESPEEKRGRGRPKGSKNKPTAEELAKQTAELTETVFRDRVRASRQEVYELATQTLIATIKAGKLPTTAQHILWSIAYDKVSAEQTPHTVINQQINVSGVGREQLLQGLGVAKRVVSLPSTQTSLSMPAPVDVVVEEKK